MSETVCMFVHVDVVLSIFNPGRTTNWSHLLEIHKKEIELHICIGVRNLTLIVSLSTTLNSAERDRFDKVSSLTNLEEGGVVF